MEKPRAGEPSPPREERLEKDLRVIESAWRDYIETDRLKFLASFTTQCPACGRNGFVINEYLYLMPRVGETIITVGICKFCGYTYRDIRLAESRGKQRLVIKVSKPSDLNIVVLKASSATVKIPELGMEMKPGPAAEGFITTIEGLLLRFKDILEFLCRDVKDGDKLRACSEKEKEIEEALEGKREFTVVIEDPEGVSAVIEEWS